ncbi:Mediator of RNA polymerase II transcription subunit 11 (Mediator complex subunit 11) [Psidium guajava]|nr:Mediator of RNA polymerase II transcription subunit 11 (Mediator complex subunit 11) [Psidium guajava]
MQSRAAQLPSSKDGDDFLLIPQGEKLVRRCTQRLGWICVCSN